DPSAVCFCQCHASEAAAPAEVETPAPATTRPFWAKPSANKVLPPSGGRTYFFSQVARAPAPARQTVAPWQQVPAPAQPPPAASSRLPATPAAHTAAPAPQPAAATGPKPVVAKRKEPNPDHPELESLHFPKDGLSRQWLEFLNQLNGAKYRTGSRPEPRRQSVTSKTATQLNETGEIPPETLRVLLVDDNAPVLRFLASAVASNDCAATTASTAEQALELLGNAPFDLVVSDIQMPGLS